MENVKLLDKASSLNQALIKAVENNHIKVVEYLLKAGAMTINSALEAAAEHGHLNLVEMFLNRKAITVNNAMIKAAKNGHLAIVKLLLKSGASAVNFAMEAGHKHLDIVKLMVNQGATSFDKTLGLAIADSNIDVVDYLKDMPFSRKDFDFDLLEALKKKQYEITNHIPAGNQRDYDDLLMRYASLHGREDIVENLLNRGVKDYRTPLLFAASGGQYKIVRRLLKLGINNDFIYEAILRALKNKHRMVAKLLLSFLGEISPAEERGIRIAAAEGGNMTVFKSIPSRTYKAVPLKSAVKSGNIEMVKLVNKGPAIDFNEAMIEAILRGYSDIVEYLINIGGSDWQGGANAAAKVDNIELVKYFIENHTLNLSQIMNEAVKANSLKVIEFLLKYDPDLYYQVNRAQSLEALRIFLNQEKVDLDKALEVAVEKSSLETIKELLNRGATITFRSIEAAVHSSIDAFLYLYYGYKFSDDELETILYQATRENKVDILQFVLRNAKIDVQSPEIGTNLWTLALDSDNLDIINLLYGLRIFALMNIQDHGFSSDVENLLEILDATEKEREKEEKELSEWLKTAVKIEE